MDEIKKIGITYIIVWDDYRSFPYAPQIEYSPDYWRKLDGLQIIRQDFGGTIYKVENSTKYNKKF